MDTLFTAMENERKQQVAPLAVRMRPRTLEDVVGQQDAVGPGSWLRAAIEQDNVSSVILYGPAGTGKTSIAHVIAESTKATFVEVSAIGGTVSDLRREIDAQIDDRLPELLTLDFSGVTFMDSSGVGLILGRGRHIGALGGRLTVQNPPRAVRRMLDLAHITYA